MISMLHAQCCDDYLADLRSAVAEAGAQRAAARADVAY
jgi:hypothetical protein